MNPLEGIEGREQITDSLGFHPWSSALYQKKASPGAGQKARAPALPGGRAGQQAARRAPALREAGTQAARRARLHGGLDQRLSGRKASILAALSQNLGLRDFYRSRYPRREAAD